MDFGCCENCKKFKCVKNVDSETDESNSEESPNALKENGIPTEDNISHRVTKETLIYAMKWMKNHSEIIGEMLHFYMKSMLQNKTIIQIQLYGIGTLLDEKCAVQLTFALSLLKRFKQKFPEITVTCQEPLLLEAEKEYLRFKNIKILETRKFSSKHFLRASKSPAAAKIVEPAFICFMIHGMHEMYEEFLEAHWTPELLSRIIIIGNNPNSYANAFDPDIKDAEKLREFAKLCKSKPLKFFDEFLDDYCFAGACVYSISKENAEILVEKFP